ncbi:syntaxin-12-like [Homarus americanus]|uniref:Syntaxin-12-like n=1 Tax=Homarus americanus TaxID=6706 RepID=A0A8J5MT75_HOMAM|nr:syntaxin-12-like [Homarus americanus]XP_042232007.1 syntaxin-12-like [Homarus americanus]KAG7163340.1 Syntaxin-12-like [Homarus americanus]
MASGYSRLNGEQGGGGSQRSYGTTNPTVGFAPAANSGTEFFQLCDKITTHLFTINNATSTLERSLKQVGTASDSQQLRDRITQINSSAGASVQETTGLLRTLQPLTHGDKQRRIQAERLHNEFQATASRFAEAQKKVVSTLRTARLPADMVAVEQDTTSASTDVMIASEQKKHQQMKEIQDLEFESAMHLEREQRVRQLESDIIDINEVMRDLSSMVTAQGEIVDSIEDNVESTHGHVEEGRDELLKAARYQNKSRRRLCICIIILGIVLAIITIIIVLHFTNQK